MTLTQPPDLFDVPMDMQEDPIRGYKQAHIVLTSMGFTFQATSSDLTYGMEADAVCPVVPGQSWFGNAQCPRDYCAPPGFTCTCGFYAHKERKQVIVLPSLDVTVCMVTLEVDLYGIIIDCEKGYRAQHQKVIQAERSPCYDALRWADHPRAQYVASHPEWIWMRPYCEDCAVKAAADTSVQFYRLTHLPGLPGLEWVEAPADIEKGGLL